MNLTKEYIQEQKKLGNLDSLIEENFNNIKQLYFILDNIGRIGKYFKSNKIEELTNHYNEKIRILAVKILGKVNDPSLVSLLKNIFLTDDSSAVKRETISSIGRMRCIEAIPFLLDVLKHDDPKIVGQAVRALLVYKGHMEIDNSLKELSNHRNEIIKNIINREYFCIKNTSYNLDKHTWFPNYLKNVVVNADVLDVLRNIKNESFHLTFTSPPYYNARDYSIYPSYDDYLNFLENVFSETYRVTKEGRFLIVNTSPVIIPRISRAHSSKRYPIPFDLHQRLISIGWEFIDDIIWMKPEYSVKNRIGGFQQHRKPLAYKPNAVTEYLMVYRKKTDRLLDWNIKQYPLDIVNNSRVDYGFETTNVWQINPKSDKVHSAIFPVELCKRVIEYYSYKGDLVFDPFGGSGTLGRTAKYLDRFFFLTEKEEKYFEYMKTFQDSNSIFDENATKFLTLEQFIGVIDED